MFVGRTTYSSRPARQSPPLTPLPSASSPTALSPNPLPATQAEEQLPQRLDPNAPPLRAHILASPFSGHRERPVSTSLHRKSLPSGRGVAPTSKPFRIRTYTKRGRGWGSEKSGHTSPETLTLPTRLIAGFLAAGRTAIGVAQQASPRRILWLRLSGTAS
jgi:hypothetical protein